MKHNLKYAFPFDSPERSEWIKNVTEFRELILPSESEDVVKIAFSEQVVSDDFEPIHVVLLSCFIEEIKQKGYKVLLSFADDELKDFIFKEVGIKNYWSEDRQEHVISPKITDLNIWRITESGKESYAISIYNYFKRKYFSEYDLSSFKNSLNELYINVFDHAEAQGNAFSYIRYDEKSRKIKVAVCDFGKGIATTLRAKYNDYKDDSEALRNAIKIGVSAKTKKHNRGFGLDNVVSALSNEDTLRIVSNEALLFISGKEITSYKAPFNFKGTLIYFDTSIDSFEKEEFLEEFSLF